MCLKNRESLGKISRPKQMVPINCPRLVDQILNSVKLEKKNGKKHGKEGERKVLGIILLNPKIQAGF